MSAEGTWRVCVVGDESSVTIRLVEHLLRHTDLHVILASRRPVRMFRERVSITQISLNSPDTVVSLFRGMNLIINTLPPSPQARFSVFRAAHAAGVSALDIMQDLPSLLELKGQTDAFDDRYLVFVPGAGFSPGLPEILASALAQDLDEVDDLEVSMVLRRSGDDEPYDYWKVSEAMARPPMIYKEGTVKPPEGELESDLYFPFPVGRVRARLMDHDELYTISSNLPRTTIRVRGALSGLFGNFYPFIKSRLSSLFEEDMKGLGVLDVLDMAPARFSRNHVSAVRVQAVGKKRGVSVRTAYTVVDSIEEMSAAMGAAAALAILNMRALGTGVRWVSSCFSPDTFLQTLARLGLRYIYEEETLSETE